MTRTRLSMIMALFVLIVVFPIAESFAADASDTTPPVLHSLSFPTTPLDTRTGPATLPSSGQRRKRPLVRIRAGEHAERPNGDNGGVYQ